MTVKQITSPTNPHIKDIKSLFLRKYRKSTGLFLAEGLRNLLEAAALDADIRQLIYLQDMRDRPDVATLREQIIARGGLILEVNQDVLEKISRKDNPQAVIGVIRHQPKDLSAIDATASKACWVVLEHIHDPGNLGTIIRTVDSVGATGVILVGQTCDPTSVEAVRATMGSLFTVPVIQCSVDNFLAWLPGWDGQIIGTTLQDSVDFRSVAYSNKLLLMMGNEQSGLPPELRGRCHHLIRLPMAGRADSLNLAVATGITLYAALHSWQA
ncbi:MAG: RNA methyltransferase [Pseudomonadota bacterium]